MKKSLLLASIAAVGGAVAFQSSVSLQATTPGTPQNGHSNISGTSKAGFFIGNGSLLTNLNAGELRTGIITLTGTSPTYIIRGTNNSGAANASGLIGVTNSPTGVTYGGWFESKSVSGRALFGYASATSGATYATYAVNNSNAGRACFGIATSLTGNTYGGFFSTLSEAGYGVLGQASSATGTTYGVYGRATSPSGYGVYSEGNLHATGVISGNGTGLTGVNADQLDGINSTAFLQAIPNPLSLTGSVAFGSIISGTNNGSSGRGVFGEATSATGTNYGGRFETASTSGRGVYGLATADTGSAHGVFGVSQSSTGRGVYGSASATSGVNYAGYFDSNSTTGYGVFANSAGPYGVYGQSASTSGHGVFGEATATTGLTFGGRFYSDSTFGSGVYGEATATTGTTYGVWGRSKSTGGVGVFGVATATTGTTYAVYGRSDSNGASAYSVYAQGKLGASGTKTFRIDHPFDPENKYLLHYSHEGPEPQNVYNGNVVTDAKGYATISLPDYFEEINKDPRYTLTIIDDSDDFVLAKVVREVRNNQFTIRTNKPSVKVSWRVDAIRNDRWVQKRGAPVEVDKEGPEKGRYQHPELYGLGPERGMNYDPERAKEQIKPKAK